MIKGNAGRVPPQPAADHDGIDEWVARLVPYLQPIIGELDETIRATVRDVRYAVKWKRAFYGLPGLGWIIELAAYDVSVNAEVHRPGLRRWIEQAARTPGWPWGS